jgi:hypothetical protein
VKQRLERAQTQVFVPQPKKLTDAEETDQNRNRSDRRRTVAAEGICRRQRRAGSYSEAFQETGAEAA